MVELPYAKFLSDMAFSIYEVVRVAFNAVA